MSFGLREEFVDWHGRIGGKETTFLVHGEETVMMALAPHLVGSRVEMPRLHESFAF